MVIDSSAIIAILTNEPDASSIATMIEKSSPRLISSVSWVETAIVIESRYGPQGGVLFDQLVAEAGIHIEPVTVEQAAVARAAYRTFGKGHHRASLNLGDCFAYALAQVKDDRLLFKGGDFDHTDVKNAEYE